MAMVRRVCVHINVPRKSELRAAAPVAWIGALMPAHFYLLNPRLSCSCELSRQLQSVHCCIAVRRGRKRLPPATSTRSPHSEELTGGEARPDLLALDLKWLTPPNPIQPKPQGGRTMQGIRAPSLVMARL